MKYRLDRWTERWTEKVAELPGSEVCDPQHKVQLDAGRWWCPPGFDAGTTTV